MSELFFRYCTAAEDDDDCTTPVLCIHCTTVILEALPEHVPVENNDCTKDIGCLNCKTIVKHANSFHTDAELDGECDECGSEVDCVKDDNGTCYVFNADGLYKWVDVVGTSTDLVIMRDITLPEENLYDANYGDTPNSNWLPVGLGANVDGRGHVIKGLRIDCNINASTALFTSIDTECTVKNLRLEGVNIKSTQRSAGITSNNYGTIINCSVSGNIYTTFNSAGGIAGYNSGTIIACYNEATIFAELGVVGGIAGQISGESLIVGSYNVGNVSGNTDGDIGGLLGIAYHTTAVACYSYATLGGNKFGGALGYAINSSTYFDAIYWKVTNETDCQGNASSSSTTGLCEVDNTNISWADALADMNRALEEGGYEWRYALNEGVDAETRPLVIVPVQ